MNFKVQGMTTCLLLNNLLGEIVQMDPIFKPSPILSN